MIQVDWITLAILTVLMLAWGWFVGESIGVKKYLRNRVVGTIVYVDKKEEAVTIQFNSEEAIHGMKNLDCVVFEVKSLN